MTVNWPSEAEQRYQAITNEQLRNGCQWLILLALALFPAFAFLDFYAHRPRFEELWTLRFSAVFIYLVLFLLVRRGRLTRYPYLLGIGLGAIAAVSITSMCMLLGGYESTYYAGINLVILALVLVMPIGAWRMALAVSLVLGIYLLGILVESGFRIDKPQALVNNLYFLIATGIIGVVAAHLTDRLRRESFSRFLAVERAQADIQYSRDVLQMELKSEQGNVEVLVREIAERKAELERALNLAQAARDEAERALHIREEFISLASHELNTPLTSLKLQTQLAQRRMHEQGLPPEAVAKLVDAYDGQLKRLIHMVGDMFDISRIKSGKLDLERTQLDLEALVRGVIERTLDADSEVACALQVDSIGPVLGEWDQFRLEQVVLNLLTNARKYGAGKPIEIGLARDGETAILRVRDQGIGIPAEAQARIFGRFERAVGTRDFGGLGLGLYISQQIVAAHGGSIEVASRVGEGSTFTVRLPLRAAAARVFGGRPGGSAVSGLMGNG